MAANVQQGHCGMDVLYMSFAPPQYRYAAAGFSLVELVVVITISGIMAGVMGLFIAEPIRAFFDQARRVALTDSAQLALTRMGRDLRAALPNSVRVSGSAIELLYALDGDRYRSEAPGSPQDQLDFTAADDSFNTLRPLGAGQVLPAGLRLAVYPLNQPGANPYAPADGVLTPAAVAVNLSPVPATSVVSGATEYRVAMTPPHRFPFDSPTRRVFLVQGPVSYVCALGELRRYAGYAPGAGQPVPPPGTPAVIARDVESCDFQYSPGTAQRNAVVYLALTLARDEERVRLMRQVQVDNSP